MQTGNTTSCINFGGRVITTGSLVLCAALVWLFAQTGFAQTATNPLSIFKNYFVTGDYVVAGWVEGPADGSGYAPGTISIPDTRQPSQNGVPATIPKGADIVAAYLYWATVEGNQSSFAGQSAFFNGYPIAGTVLGNPNAPTSWSAGGCGGASMGSKTMRTYRADVRPYLPLDGDPASSTFGSPVASGSLPVRLADSGSNGNATPFALGATLVIIYRVVSPSVPLNAIVLYDGAYAPSNTAQTSSQTIKGFYQPAVTPVAKLTHIVANGQANKSEQVYLNSGQALPSLYGALPPFPGVYNGSWDNPTWVLSSYGYVTGGDTQEITTVTPTSTNTGCVSWGAMILSTTVQDTDHDGLLDVWEQNQGYVDAVSGQAVPLPGADPNVKDLFVEVDYLTNLDGSGGAYLHSHLAKQAALDMVGNAFKSAPIDYDPATGHYKGVRVHFDVGNVYQSPLAGGPSALCGGIACDPYIISNPAGIGGNAISEGALVCTDGVVLCPFPGQPAVGWKGGLQFIRDNASVPGSMPPVPLGNFQAGRKDSYHYVLFGHSLAEPRSFWGTLANVPGSANIPQLMSIVDSGTTATVTIQSPAGFLKPGDPVIAGDPAFGDANLDRVTVTGALGQPSLNGTYHFSIQSQTTDPATNRTTTILTIPTSGVANGTYNSSNEPQLGVSYAGPTSSSGHSDFDGGADSAVTFGLWTADDLPGCQADPSIALQPGQAYCTNEVGTLTAEAGTLLHELGHTLTLTHGGTYYKDPLNPYVPTFGSNCKSNVLSVMSYFFQIRGFPEGGIDYSGQTLPNLSESALNEAVGIGLDMISGLPAAHFTRWYAPPNALDIKLQNTSGGRFATAHCDGTSVTPGEPPAVRVDGRSFGAPIDWNNNLIVPDLAEPVAWQDVDFNGSTISSPDAVFEGFNDWLNVDFRQIGGRPSAFGFSGGSGTRFEGGGTRFEGGGTRFEGGGTRFEGGGADQDADAANSTADPPTRLTAVQNSHNVVVTWTPPGFGQIRKYFVWRAVGSFPTLQSVLANFSAFSNIKTLTGNPPTNAYTDTTVKNKTTYTYFVTDANKPGAQSGPSTPVTITVVF